MGREPGGHLLLEGLLLAAFPLPLPIHALASQALPLTLLSSPDFLEA